MQRRQHLRHHQRRGRALRQPCDDQLRAGLREAAPQRRRGEAEHAGEEHVLGAMDVAEPAAGDDQRGVGDQIDRDDGFDLRRRRVQLGRDGRDRDVDDEGIDAEHELCGDHDRQHPPAAGQIDRLCDGLMHWRASFGDLFAPDARRSASSARLPGGRTCRLARLLHVGSRCFQGFGLEAHPMYDYDMVVIGSGPSGAGPRCNVPSSARPCWWWRKAGGSAASPFTPARSPRRRCARPCSTSPAGASAASTAAPTASSRTSRRTI